MYLITIDRYEVLPRMNVSSHSHYPSLPKPLGATMLHDRMNYTKEVEDLMVNTTLQMVTLGHGDVYPVHLLPGFAIKPGELAAILRDVGLTPDKSHMDQLRTLIKPLYDQVEGSKSLDKPYVEPTQAVLDASREFAKDYGDGPLPSRPDHVFLALLEAENEEVLTVLDAYGIDVPALQDSVLQLRAQLDRRQMSFSGD